ncbi:MAG TPA: MBL fold metallo-hydrolase [Firmicutes bacterium]|nr:MBL fold metallo-hydrolase [Bacillota bacterium]
MVDQRRGRLELSPTENESSVSQIALQKDISLYRLDLFLPVPGFKPFITPWLIREHCGQNRCLLVDPGPSSSISQLVQKLHSLGVFKIDYVLLTHIHIDHAGGLANLLQEYPEARVLAHPKARGHLLDPSKLWAGSLKTLGQLAETYGEILPVREETLLPEGIAPEGFQIIATPGHAPHHQCYVYNYGAGKLLFAGEAGGIYLQGQPTYLRPATPPKFLFDVTMASLNTLIGLEASVVCYGHIGFSSHPNSLLRLHREQLFLWRDVVNTEAREGHELSAHHLTETLLSTDPLLGAFRVFDNDVRKREEYFLQNSINGFLESVK